MRTVSIFKNGSNQAIRLPKDMEFNVSELEIVKEGETITLRPARPTWTSLQDCVKAQNDFLEDRPPVIEEGRF
ncbi:hypothetical protein WH50_06475 [Pokkaliibacter plantistimulans]|uniref:SpoVT-AbrB domain-containing protein n=1 Tax=Pokkaliibacter plantistimulans TaxID=1635171 RepID=A0ABX5LZJ1_9GAMM|nr:type II toxin-antitoxin system VapB family antitoxin [Pokkaliibacter plantistimulans]PXF32096.1 hypothetical protein WH50_06475 [Pokkaliibacter plantistimulans]